MTQQDIQLNPGAQEIQHLSQVRRRRSIRPQLSYVLITILIKTLIRWFMTPVTPIRNTLLN